MSRVKKKKIDNKQRHAPILQYPVLILNFTPE